jgi:hypothetical protein
MATGTQLHLQLRLPPALLKPHISVHPARPLDQVTLSTPTRGEALIQNQGQVRRFDR